MLQKIIGKNQLLPIGKCDGSKMKQKEKNEE